MVCPQYIVMYSIDVLAYTEVKGQVNRARARPICAWIALACKDGASLNNGDSIQQAVKLCDAAPHVFAVGVNCTPPQVATEGVRVVFDAGSVVFDAVTVVFDAGRVVLEGVRLCRDDADMVCDAVSVVFDADSVSLVLWKRSSHLVSVCGDTSFTITLPPVE